MIQNKGIESHSIIEPCPSPFSLKMPEGRLQSPNKVSPLWFCGEATVQQNMNMVGPPRVRGRLPAKENFQPLRCLECFQMLSAQGPTQRVEPMNMAKNGNLRSKSNSWLTLIGECPLSWGFITFGGEPPSLVIGRVDRSGVNMRRSHSSNEILPDTQMSHLSQTPIGLPATPSPLWMVNNKNGCFFQVPWRANATANCALTLGVPLLSKPKGPNEKQKRNAQI